MNKFEGWLVFLLLFFLAGPCQGRAIVSDLKAAQVGKNAIITGTISNISQDSELLKFYLQNSEKKILITNYSANKNGHFSISVDSFVIPAGFEPSVEFVQTQQNSPIQNNPDSKPRVFVDKITFPNETTAEFALHFTNIKDTPINGQIYWKKADGSQDWRPGELGTIGTSIFNRFWFLAKNLDANTDYYLRVEVKSPTISILKESEIVKVNNKEVVREKANYRVFKVGRLPKVMMHSVKVDKDKPIWSVDFLAGVDSLNSNFSGWFSISEEGGKIYNTQVIAYPKKVSSFAAKLAIANQVVFADGKKVEFSFKPGKKYSIVAHAANTIGTSTAVAKKELKIDLIPAFVNTEAVSHITSRSAILHGQVGYLGQRPAVAGFKLWKKSEKPPYAFNPNLDKGIKISENSDLKFLAELDNNTQYCYFAWAKNDLQKNSYSTGTTVCFKTGATDYLDVPFFSQNDPRWGNCSWNECNLEAVFWKSGCGETALSQIVSYWYKLDPFVRQKWDAEYQKLLQYYKKENSTVYRRILAIEKGASGMKALGKGPNPYFLNKYMRANGAETCDWNEKLTEVLAKINLRIFRLKDNNKNYVEKNFIGAGIPILTRCAPSWNTGLYPGHFGVVSGFFGKKQYYSVSGQEFYDEMYINDPGKKVEEENIADDKKRGRAQKLSVNSETFYAQCGYQYRSDKEALRTLEGATAIFPTDYPGLGFAIRPYDEKK